jgi:hypothetical protein
LRRQGVGRLLGRTSSLAPTAPRHPAGGHPPPLGGYRGLDCLTGSGARRERAHASSCRAASHHHSGAAYDSWGSDSCGAAGVCASAADHGGGGSPPIAHGSLPRFGGGALSVIKCPPPTPGGLFYHRKKVLDFWGLEGNTWGVGSATRRG